MSARSQDAAPRVLLADDDGDVRKALQLLLKAHGFRSQAVDSAAAALAALREGEFDAVLADMNFTRDTSSGAEGLELIEQAFALAPHVPVIALTAFGSVELAVAAMRRGARDFVQKPWENERLINVVRTQVELARALREGRRLAAENRALRGEGETPEIVASSPAMRAVVEMVERVGPSAASVLVTGENGSGKGLVARALHAASERAEAALITVNVGGLTESLFESELFGHVRGAFTDASSDRIGRFELAGGGTLFLDEVGNLSPAQQSKLLRVLETGEFERVGSSRTQRADVRVLSATNADLRGEVEAGRFRRDLYFRLNAIEIHVPPLRERAADLPLLAHAFLRRHARRYRKELDGLEPAAEAALRAHAWPGNVRELDHAVERGVLLARGPRVRAADLGLVTERGGAPALDALTLSQAERVLIERALERHQGNLMRAARDLGVSRAGLYRRLEKHGLARPEPHVE
jgi:DNA-binding NtrC family response regulator